MNPFFRLRVILLEDNDALRLLFSEIFADREYEIFAFSTPAICPLQMMPECRCGVNETCTDLIVSDLDMPQMTGLSFMENQKKKKCKCKYVALISARWTEQDLLLAHELGCKTFVKSSHLEGFYEWLDEVEKSIEPTRELRNWFQEQGSLSEN